jgi:hypothetical protein
LPSQRVAVSTYLEVFLLIGLVIGGSAVVLAAGLPTMGSARGPAVSLADATIRQGEHVATVSVLVYNTGSTPFGSFVLSTEGVSAASSYCYALYEPQEGSSVFTTCPRLALDPTSVTVSTYLNPGKGVLMQLTVLGAPFSPGTISSVTVTTSSGAQQSVDVEVVPA